MTARLVLAVDGGAGSRAVIRWAIHHIGASDSMVDLVSVLERRIIGDAPVMEHVRPLAEEMLVRAAVTLRTMLPAAKISTSLLEGDPADEFLRLSRRATMVVVGANRSAASVRSTVGALCARIAARSHCVTIIVPASWVPRIGPVVVGTASDQAAQFAVDFAVAEARHSSSDLVMVHAWQLPGVGFVEASNGGVATMSIPGIQRHALDVEVERVRVSAPGLKVLPQLRKGVASAELLQLAQTASLLVVGRRDRPGIARALLGSVSRDVLGSPPCPVAVVPQGVGALDAIPPARPAYV